MVGSSGVVPMVPDLLARRVIDFTAERVSRQGFAFEVKHSLETLFLFSINQRNPIPGPPCLGCTLIVVWSDHPDSKRCVCVSV